MKVEFKVYTKTLFGESDSYLYLKGVVVLL